MLERDLGRHRPHAGGVLRTGQATWSTDARYFFDRELPQEEVFVTFTYGPILADDGITVQGVFCPCTDTTEKIVSRRRLERCTAWASARWTCAVPGRGRKGLRRAG